MRKTGELSRLFEIDRTTLNYYVKTGLLQPSDDQSQYHRYSLSDSMALAYIRYYRGLGFRTEEIAALLNEDDNRKKMERICGKQEELAGQIKIFQLKQLLLENLHSSLSFIEKYRESICPLKTDAYYFVPKKSIEKDPFWMELYKMVPSIEFSVHIDPVSDTEHQSLPDLFSGSGLSLKEDWLERFSLEPPPGSVFYPSRDIFVCHFYLLSANLQEGFFTRIREIAERLPQKHVLSGNVVFYLFPAHYDSPEGGFDCLCFLD